MAQQLHWTVLMAVAVAGALTTRRVIRVYGPKPNWQSLIEQKYLREYQTVYGPVLALSDKGRASYVDRPPEARHAHWPYLSGPSTVADRAYQNDALATLTSQGYQVQRHEYKRAGQVGAAARGNRKHTGQITRTVMQVPEPQLRALLAGWGEGISHLPSSMVATAPRTGRPYLYASISNGGIKLPRLKALVKQHRGDVTHWHTPLLIAVPEEGDLRAYLRSIDARARALFDQEDRQYHQAGKAFHPAAELIIVPN